jgi:hypothetical protein
MKNFLLLILLFILAYSLLKAILRLFNVFKANNNSNGQTTNKTYEKKGTTITYSEDNQKKKRFEKNAGDYIDYEEIK